MTFVKIPTELLMKIASYLSPNDKRIGLQVCKDWYEPFRYELYFSIEIQTIYELEILWKSILLSSTLNQKQSIFFNRNNGHLIRQLYINDNPFTLLRLKKIEIDKVLKLIFQQLPDLCPNLEVLDFNPEIWEKVQFDKNIIQWHKLRQLPILLNLDKSIPYLNLLGDHLTTLSIQSQMLVHPFFTDQMIISVLSKTPHLKRLIIKGDSDMNRPTLYLTVEDIELIHDRLPSLESLEITGDTIQMTSPGQHFSHYSSAHNLKSLYLDTSLTSITWIPYIIHKYPYLQELKLNIKYHDHTLLLHPASRLNSVQERSHHHKSLFLKLAQTLPQLKHLQLACPLLEDWLNPTFLDTLQHHHPDLQQVSPLLHRGSQIRFDPDLQHALQHPTLIQQLELDQWRLQIGLPYTLQLLQHFRQLERLEITCDAYQAELDTDQLLDHLPRLRQLSLTSGTLRSRPTLTRHPLQRLQLTFISFDAHLFESLAIRCPHLIEIGLNKCKQISPMNDLVAHTRIRIEMPDHRLEKVWVIGTKIECSAGSVFFNNSGSVRLGRLREGWVRQAAEVDWLEGSDEIQAYFDHLESVRLSNQMDFLRLLSTRKLDHRVKTDLMFGYVQLNCKYVRNFCLNGR